MIRLFLTPKAAGPVSTGRREKSDHASVDDAKAAYAKHPQRTDFEALIYVDGAATWVGNVDDRGRVDWQPWRI